MLKKNVERQSFAVIGLGKFGSSVAMELAEAGGQVLAIDNNPERVNDVRDYVTSAVIADALDSRTLLELSVGKMDAVIVAITGSLDASIMATMYAKESGVPLVIAKASSEMHAKILKKAGADRVIIPERESGVRVAHNILAGNFLEFVELTEKIRMVEIKVKPEWAGKNLKELRLRNKYGANVVALRLDGEQEAQLNPDPELKLDENMTLWLVVDKANMDKMV